MTIEHFAVGPLQCTCTVIADQSSGEALVVDGGDEPERILERLSALGVRATHLVHTHAHIDHVGALAVLRERTGALGLLHPEDLPLYRTLHQQALWLGVAPPQTVGLDGDLVDGDRFRVGDATLEVLHTPGHTPGSVTFMLQSDGATRLLSGDTLFRGGVGRWDLGGTSLEDIVHSIRSKLLGFPDDTVVIPGHGPFTTIGTERAENPFLLSG